MSDAHLFQLLGLTYVAVGAGLWIQPGYSLRLTKSFAESPAALYLAGLLAVTAGFLLVGVHHSQGMHWPLLLTIFGWIALIKGLWILVLPQSMASMLKSWKPNPGLLSLQAILVIAIGTLFLWLGWGLR